MRFAYGLRDGTETAISLLQNCALNNALSILIVGIVARASSVDSAFPSRAYSRIRADRHARYFYAYLAASDVFLGDLDTCQGQVVRYSPRPISGISINVSPFPKAFLPQPVPGRVGSPQLPHVDPPCLG